MKKRKKKHNEKRTKKSKNFEDNTSHNTVPQVTLQKSNKLKCDTFRDTFPCNVNSITPPKPRYTINNQSDSMRSISTRSKHPVDQFTFNQQYKDNDNNLMKSSTE